MLKELFKDKKHLALLFLASLGLIFVRAFESKLFYDPFLSFFKLDYQNKPLPDFDGIHLFWGISFRYAVNAFFSLCIIYLLFKQIQLLKFAIVLFVVLFVILIVLFFSLIQFLEQPDYLILFYVRRFLIQPLFLVLFIPAFYYQ